MNDQQIIKKTQNAAKWSAITEVCTRCISPITQMILARILAPEIFGVVATVNMVISFTDMFTDAGFQKYIVQHEFRDDDELYKNTNVAFWTNMFISICLWLLIIILRNPIAGIVGAEGKGVVIAVACVQLPLTAFSSIQMSMYRRKFNFRSLFYMRIVVAIIPLVITIPLALLGFGYWSLIFGNICSILAQAIILTAKSSWKPRLFFDFSILREMLSFSLWSMFETIAIWFTAWIDSFVVGSILDEYYLGLYNTSLNMVNSVIAIVTFAVTPVLFASLSRVQFEQKTFNQIFLTTQKLTAYLLLPIGVGIFLYRDLATSVLLGNQWGEASDIIGILAVSKAVRTILVSINSEAYRAKGLPKLSLFLQIIDFAILIPGCLLSIQSGFWSMVYCRAIIMCDLIIPGLIVMDRIIKVPAKEIVCNLFKPCLCTGGMIIFSMVLQNISSSFLWSWISIGCCVLFYIVMLFVFDRKMVDYFFQTFKRN